MMVMKYSIEENMNILGLQFLCTRKDEPYPKQSEDKIWNYGLCANNTGTCWNLVLSDIYYLKYNFCYLKLLASYVSEQNHCHHVCIDGI